MRSQGISGLDGLVWFGSESNFVIEILDDYSDENDRDSKYTNSENFHLWSLLLGKH